MSDLEAPLDRKNSNFGMTLVKGLHKRSHGALGMIERN
jgi:hypothetical protein